MAVIISGNGIDMGGNPVSNASQIDSTVINENGSNVATEVNVNAQIANATKIGTIITFPVNVTPTGFLECNGTLISRTAYADLFAVIGTTYGAGDGSTTFKIPDLRGEFIRGFDNGRGVDAGRTIGSSQADAYGSHSHTGSTNSTGAHTHGYTGNVANQNSSIDIGFGSSNGVFGAATTSSAGAHSHTVTINASGSTETRPRNIAMMYCIKY